jgi:hypothetical protein
MKDLDILLKKFYSIGSKLLQNNYDNETKSHKLLQLLISFKEKKS